MTPSLPLILAVLLVLWLGLHRWLAARQIMYLKRRGDPGTVGGAITRTRIGVLGTLAEAALGLGFAGGGWDEADLGAGAALIAVIVALQALVRWTVHAAAQGAPGAALRAGLRRGLLAGALALPVIVGVLACWRHGLWLAAWALWSLGITAKIAVYPLLVTILFERCADSAQSARHADLLTRCGLRPSVLRIVRAAGSGGRANAGCVGIGRARRIVVQDTLLARLTPAQVDAVLAHEAGHIQGAHHARYLAGLCLAGLAGFALLAVLSSGTGTARDLACAVLALPALAFIGLRVPAVAVRRRWELAADAFAARHVAPADLIAAIRRLDAGNGTLYAADPLYAAFFAFHPDPATRAAALGVAISSHRPIVGADGA